MYSPFYLQKGNDLGWPIPDRFCFVPPRWRLQYAVSKRSWGASRILISGCGFRFKYVQASEGRPCCFPGHRPMLPRPMTPPRAALTTMATPIFHKVQFLLYRSGYIHFVQAHVIVIKSACSNTTSFKRTRSYIQKVSGLTIIKRKLLTVYSPLHKGIIA